MPGIPSKLMKQNHSSDSASIIYGVEQVCVCAASTNLIKQNIYWCEMFRQNGAVLIK